MKTYSIWILCIFSIQSFKHKEPELIAFSDNFDPDSLLDTAKVFLERESEKIVERSIHDFLKKHKEENDLDWQ